RPNAVNRLIDILQHQKMAALASDVTYLQQCRTRELCLHVQVEILNGRRPISLIDTERAKWRNRDGAAEHGHTRCKQNVPGIQHIYRIWAARIISHTR